MNKTDARYAIRDGFMTPKPERPASQAMNRLGTFVNTLTAAVATAAVRAAASRRR